MNKLKMVDQIYEDAYKMAMKCVAAVEANSFETMCIWSDYSPSSDKKTKWHANEWTQILSGGMFTLGNIYKRPINVEYRFAIIDGHYVMFYSPCSSLVDYRMVQNWLDHELPGVKVKTEAPHFHIVMNMIRELNKVSENA